MNQTHVDGVLRTFPKKEAGGKPKWNTNRNQKAPPTPRMTKLEKLQKKMEQVDYSEETVVVKKHKKLSKKKKELKKKKFEEKVTAKYGNVEHQMLGGDDSDSDYSTASVTDMLEPEVEEETTVPLAKSLKDMYGYVGEPTHEDNAAPQLRKKLKEQRKGKKKGVVESVKMEETEDDEGDEEIVVKQNGKSAKGNKKAETQTTLKGKKKTVVGTQTVGQKGKRGKGKEMKEEVKEEMEESEDEEEEERGMIQKGKWMKEEMKEEEEDDDDEEMDVSQSGYEMEPFGEQDEDSESDFEEQMNERATAAKRGKREAKAMTGEASSDEDYGEGPEMEMDEEEMEEDDDFEDEDDDEEEEGGSSRPSRNMRPGLPGDSDSDFEQPPDEEDLQSPSFRQDLANMPLRKVQELKNKLGLKNFNKAYFGVTEEDKERERKMKQERRERVFERDTRHRPLEVTSKRPVSRFRNVYENDRTARKKQGFDPRFDPRCGEFEENVFESSYGFLKDIREKDKLTLRKAIQAAKKEEDTETVRRLRKTLRDMENQDKTKTEREMKRSTVRDLKKENIERLKQGMQPVYKTRADVRMMNTEKKFGQLKKEHRVDKYLKHQSKKQSMKGNMPAPRREYE